LERALIAGHDVVLLGERGQGKTRLLRALSGLLDEWTPVIEGAELGEHPYTPITPESIRRAADMGDDLPVAWRHRSERYTEKLATPDTSVADLVGDIDPIKVAEGRSLGDPETIAYGLIPRAHRGIVAVNELPDLAERIQVSMLNVMEERDIQVRATRCGCRSTWSSPPAPARGLRNRGRIITPLKDRFAPRSARTIRWNWTPRWASSPRSAPGAEVPEYLLQILPASPATCAESSSVDQRSGPARLRSRRPRRSRRPPARSALLGGQDPWPGGRSRHCDRRCAASWN
jgi:magnesium chelatase subunit I